METGEQRVLKIVGKRDTKMQLDDSEETHVMSVVDHPNIVKLHEVLETNSELYISMEEMDRDLFTLLQRKRKMDEQEVREVCISVMSSLSYLHRLDIIHRDVKLENILISSEPRAVKLADFGYAKFATETNKPAGTSFYQAPEVLNAQLCSGQLTMEESKKSDVFSLGVVLFYLICGRPPFLGRAWPPIEKKKLIDLMTERVAIDDSRWPASTSIQCREFICLLLHPNQSQRLSASEALGHHFVVGSDIRSSNSTTHEHTIPTTPLVQCPA